MHTINKILLKIYLSWNKAKTSVLKSLWFQLLYFVRQQQQRVDLLKI